MNSGDGPSGQRQGGRHAAPDEHQTTIIPSAVRDPRTAALPDQVQEVKAALDGAGAKRASAPPPPPLEPPDTWFHTLLDRLRGWGAKRWAAAAAIVFVVLPVVTFAMAYLVVSVPKPGDIRTNQVSTVLYSDGTELAKVVPPEGNRVDVDIDQVPVHVRDAVMAAEDRDF